MRHFKISVFIFFIFAGLNLSSAKGIANISPDSTDSTVTEVKNVIPSSQEPIHELSLWAGYSFDSMRLWGKTKDVTMQYFGLRYNRKFLNIHGAEVEYILKLSIFSKYSYPMFMPGRPRNSLTGFGLAPLGFQVNFLSDKIIQPFINANGGFVILDAPFPDWRGKKFNFTLGVGGGVEFMLSPSVSLSVGLRYHHLSNGERGEVNPGIDSGILYSAITFF